MTEKELTRAFICIQFPEEIVKEITRVQEALSGVKFTGKMTELENLHLTLKFLGEIDGEKLNKVREKLRGIEFNEFEAKLWNSGAFSIHGNPRIAWVKIGGKGIFELQKKIDDTLSELFKPEERFMSHLTIARIKYVKDKLRFKEFVSKIGVKKLKFKVNKFIFMKSELKPMGPVYTEIENYFELNTKQKG